MLRQCWFDRYSNLNAYLATFHIFSQDQSSADCNSCLTHACLISFIVLPKKKTRLTYTVFIQPEALWAIENSDFHTTNEVPFQIWHPVPIYREKTPRSGSETRWICPKHGSLGSPSTWGSRNIFVLTEYARHSSLVLINVSIPTTIPFTWHIV